MSYAERLVEEIADGGAIVGEVERSFIDLEATAFVNRRNEQSDGGESEAL